jgi:hypothetical protein
MVVAIIGSVVTGPVFEEIQAALDRTSRPPIGVFFDTTVARGPSAESARDQLRNLTVFGDFTSVVGLKRHVSAFLAQKVHLARQNRASPAVLARERVVVAPGEEERRAFLLVQGDTVRVLAEAIKPSPLLPRQRFHFALLPSAEFVERTAITPYTRFGLGEDRYTFERTLHAQQAGYCYMVIRRPWWFQLGRSTVDLTVLLSRPTA